MSKLPKILDYFIYILILVVAFSIVTKQGEKQKLLPISLWYVYSQSMEPTLMTNDGFILITRSQYTYNDVITFKPKYLDQPYVTHRVVGVDGEGRYITKGDNNPMSDQQGGEPPVEKAQVIGKALEFNNKLIIIPQLGTLSNQTKSIVKGLNVFTLLAMVIAIILVEYIFDKVMHKKRAARRKRIRLLDIAPYLDYSFFIFSITVILNALLIGITIQGWSYEPVSYVVVATEGLASPMPGETYSKVLSLENKSFIPFITVLETKNTSVNIEPKELLLKPGASVDYKIELKAPEKLGFYTEKILKRTYPYILPLKLFDLLYSKNLYFTLIIVLIPGAMISLGTYIWWMLRWRTGRRLVMPWLISLRDALRSL